MLPTEPVPWAMVVSTMAAMLKWGLVGWPRASQTWDFADSKARRAVGAGLQAPLGVPLDGRKNRGNPDACGRESVQDGSNF